MQPKTKKKVAGFNHSEYSQQSLHKGKLLDFVSFHVRGDLLLLLFGYLQQNGNLLMNYCPTSLQESV